MADSSGSRPSYDGSEDRNDPEDALLSSVRKRQTDNNRKDHWLKLGLGIWAAVATVAVVIVATMACVRPSGSGSGTFPPKGKRSVVFMVSDGMGPTSLSLTRSFQQQAKGLHWDQTLILDKNLIGTSRTRSTSSLVTDSAAGATAFGCALKSYNGAIAVLPDGSPCGTVLEAAKMHGYMTGLVVTTRMTDATPACFSAHVNLRSEEDRIAEQQLGDYPLGRVVDLMLGGGRCHFQANSTEGSCRGDDRDLVTEAQEKYGFTYLSDRAGFDSLKGGKGQTDKLPLLGLFAPTDIPYDLDRKDAEYPSLVEMAEAAITILEEATKDSDKGFFLMVEGSRIDHAGHGNDPAAQVREVLAYDKAFTKMLEWVDAHDAVLVSTSDHETGGLAVARQLHPTYPEYLWYPQVLVNASSSSEFLGAKYRDFTGTKDEEHHFILHDLLKAGLGIENASDDEIESIKAAKPFADYVFADMISRRAQIGWSTHGHSGVDVNIYGSKGTDRLHGNHENTDIGAFLADYLNLDLEEVSSKLRDTGVDRTSQAAGEEHNQYPWMGRSLKTMYAEKEANDPTGHFHHETDCIDEYHGDFRKREALRL